MLLCFYSTLSLTSSVNKGRILSTLTYNNCIHTILRLYFLCKMLLIACMIFLFKSNNFLNIQTVHRAFYFFKSFGAYVFVYFVGLAAFVFHHFLNIPKGGAVLERKDGGINSDRFSPLVNYRRGSLLD